MKRSKFWNGVLALGLLVAAPALMGSMGDELIYSIIIGIVVACVLFLIARELVCWYWKINAMVSKLTEISETLKRIETRSPLP